MDENRNKMNSRTVADSHTVQTYLLMPGHMNAAGSLFGGQLLSWIDMLAGIVALRHCDAKVVTVAIDHLEFKRPAHVGDVITLDARTTWVGSSSMEVRIDTYRENKGGQKELINTAFVVMVAVDDECNHTIPVPRLTLSSDAERVEWQAAEKRARLRKQRRSEDY